MRVAMAQSAVEVPQRAKSETRAFLSFLAKLGIAVFILRSFGFALFSIPSESMVPRLLTGDYLEVNKWSYGFSRYSFPFGLPLIPGPQRLFGALPARGDVVVFKEPPENQTDYIKRVIGLPGDRIQMKQGQLFLNGQPIPKRRISDFLLPLTPNTHCYSPQFSETASNGQGRCRYAQYRETLPGGKSYDVLDLATVPADDTQIYAVPPGMLFLMGDNRDNSSDSRLEAAGFGFVPLENLVGKAQVSVFSTDGSASWLLPWTWLSAARWRRIGEGF